MRFRDLHPNLKIRLFEFLLSNVLGNMIYPFMTIYFAQRFGAAMAGVMMTATVIAGIVASFYGGPLADRLGRKRVLLIAEGLRLTAYALMALSNSPWFDWPLVTFVMAMFLSIFWGLSSPATDAMILDCTTEENRKLVYSLSYWAWNVSLLVGGIAGGFLFETHRFEIFLAAAVISFVALLLLVFFITETYQPAAHDSGTRAINPLETLRSYRRVLADRMFLLFCLASLLNGSIENMALNYTGVRLEQEFQTQSLLDIGDWSLKVNGVKMFGFLTSENALLVALLGLMIPHWIKDLREKTVLFTGIFLYTFGYSVLSATNAAWLLVLFMVFATVGELIWVPVMQAMVARSVPDDSRSTYMAFYGMTHQGNMLLGTLAVSIGAVLPSIGMAGLFFLSGMLSLVLFAGLLKRKGESVENADSSVPMT